MSSSIRGTLSFGVSTLDNQQQRVRSYTEEGTSLSSLGTRSYDVKPNSRRSLIHTPFHVSGEVIGSSSFKRLSFKSSAAPGNTWEMSNRGDLSVASRLPALRSRATTWDSSMGRLSPIPGRKSMESTESSDTSRPANTLTTSLPSSSITSSLMLEKLEIILSDESGSEGSKQSFDSTEELKEKENHTLGSEVCTPKGQTEVTQNDLKSRKIVTFQERIDVDSEHESEETKFPHSLPQWVVSGEEDDIIQSASQSSSRTVSNSPQQPSAWSKINPLRDLSWSLAGSCIVRTAPCFWCSKKLGLNATDREILLRMNMLCLFFCIVQAGVGGYHFFANFIGHGGDDGPFINGVLWSLQLFVYFLSIVSAILGITCLFARRWLRDVNLVGSVRFMWTLLWVLPLQIYFMIGLFDYYSVNIVYTKHWWDDPINEYSREIFCVPPQTANNQCIVPINGGGGEYNSEEEWCLAKYNATNCTQIRDDAQAKYIQATRIFYTADGIWACCLVVLIWFTLWFLEAIITVPIVQRSKESNIPMWLSTPAVGCCAIGYLLAFRESEYKATAISELQDVYWIAVAYIISGGAFTLAAVIGLFLKYYTVLNGKQRRFKQGVVVIFILTIVLAVIAVLTIFTTSLIYSLNILDLSIFSHGTIACYLDTGDACSHCDSENPIQRCPEWSKDDVTSILDTILKQSASFAAICFVYAIIALRYGFQLFRYVSRYQIEYV